MEFQHCTSFSYPKSCVGTTRLILTLLLRIESHVAGSCLFPTLTVEPVLMKFIAIVLVAVVVSTAIAAEVVDHTSVMRASHDSAFVVVDVRDSALFRRGQVPSSINLPCPACFRYNPASFGTRTVVLVGNKADRKNLDTLASNFEYSKVPVLIDGEAFETYPFPVVTSTAPYYVNITCKAAFSSTPRPYVIDVRELDEYAGGHTISAFNVPLGHLRDRSVEIDVTRRVHVMCRSGFRSTKATLQMIEELGFTDIVNINDGVISCPGPLETSPMPNYVNVTRDDLKKVYATSVVIDVRAAVDYKARHIPSARNIPFAELKARAAEVPADAYVVCYSGRSSLSATKMLADMGKTGLKNLLRGMEGWDGPVQP